MAYQNQESALGNSLLAQQASGMPQPFNHQIPPMPDVDSGIPPMTRCQPYDMPQPNTQFGTPRDDNRHPMSPVTNLTTLDVPLPASFDSNAHPFMTRPGPHAASVPSKFSLEPSSPPSSLPKNGLPSETLRNLHESAYSASMMSSNYGSSPSGPVVEDFSRRMMHSQRIGRPKLMSSSLPPSTTELGDDLLFGGVEEYIPGNLSHLLSEQERTRRFSGKTDDPSAIRESLSGTPVDNSIKVGSPSTNSPSRFSALFNKQKQEEQGGFLSSSFGHVGSPLRNSSLHLGTSPNRRPGSRASASESGIHLYGSSPQQRAPSTSMLSQQLRQTHLRGSKSADSGHEILPGATARHASNPRSGYDRAVSSSSVGVSRIEEEQPDIFTLDDEELMAKQPSGSGGTNNAWASANKNAFGSIGAERHLMATLAQMERSGEGGKEVAGETAGEAANEVTNGITIPKIRQRSPRLDTEAA